MTNNINDARSVIHFVLNNEQEGFDGVEGVFESIDELKAFVKGFPSFQGVLFFDYGDAARFCQLGRRVRHDDGLFVNTVYCAELFDVQSMRV